MRNIRITLAYDGTAYCGWQIQQNGVTVQEKVEQALHRLTGERLRVIGCSRTDAGVHARGFVLNFHTESTIPAERFAAALNAFLPDDITACSSDAVPDGFHAQYDAMEKTYRYLFYPSAQPSALLCHRAWHLRMASWESATDARWEETRAEMAEAASHWVGTHDFCTFRAVGSAVTTTERTIYRTAVHTVPAGLLTDRRLFCFEIAGNGFLYNMVRIMAGTLAGVLGGRFAPSDMATMLESCERKNAGMTAPAHGLYLECVRYDLPPVGSTSCGRLFL